GDGLYKALVEELDRLLDAVGLNRVRAEPLRQSREELEERLVGDLAPRAGIELAVDRPRVDEALEQPHRGAVREDLELGDTEGHAALQLLEHRRMRESRRAVERRPRPLEAPLPAVRERDPERRRRLGSG